VISDSVRLRDKAVIRPMRLEDLDRVMAIERSSFDHPWTVNNFLDEFKNPDLSIQLVLECDGQIMAYAVIWIVLDECHLANIAVCPEFRRRGVSEILLTEIIRIAKEKKCAKVMLEVRRSNKPAIQLYEKFHFERVGVRKNYYHDGFMKSEDAVLMDLDLTAR
jgi:ribosomal-protein-alanine N-acetyltransferase